MESAHKSGGGSTPGAGAGAGAEGVLCHACGYHYPNGHPSAKQRRAHRKHCGKPTSTGAGAAEEGAGEHDGGDLLLGEGGGGGAGADGNGAGAAECGGGSPGSAHDDEPGDALEGAGDSAGAVTVADPSGDGAGHQVIGDKSAEDCLVISSNVPSEITSEASRTDDNTLTTVQYSEKASPIEDGGPSDPVVSSEQLQDIPTSVVSPEPDDRAKFSSEISENEIQNSSIVPLESDAAGGGTSELTSDLVRQQDGVVVTGEDGMINTIVGDSKSSEGKSVQGDEPGLSCQDILQTEIGEGHHSAVVVGDSSDKSPAASNNEEILNGETESDQSKHALTESFEEVPNIEPVESSVEKSVGTDDELLQPGKGGCHSEIPEDIKAQQQHDSTSGVADHLAISQGADNAEGQHYPTTDESIEAIPSTFRPAVGAKVISVDASANLTEDICSSGTTMDDSMLENVASGTAVPSQVDLLNLSPAATAHGINTVISINDVDEKSQNEKGISDLASYEVKEVVKDDFEEQTKEFIVDPTPYEANSFPNTDNHEENEQNGEIVADTTSYKISAIQSMSSTEEKEQIEEFIENLASEDINVTRDRDMVEQQDETDVKTNHGIDGAHSIEATGENNAITGESNAGTIRDGVEDKMPNEEITSGTISLDITDGSVNEEKMHSEEANKGLGDDIVVHDPDNVKEKMYEETTSGPAIEKFSLLTSTESPEESKDESTSADPISQETNVAQTSDGVDEEQIKEPAVYPTSSIGTIGSIGDAADKKPSEETTADPRPVENTTTQGTEDAESSKKNENITSIGDAEDKMLGEETATDARPVENTTTQGTEDTESSKQNENTTSIGDAEDKKQSEETAPDPRSIETATAQSTEDIESSKQNENTTTKDETALVSQNTNVIEAREMVEDTASKEISTIESTDDLKGATDQSEEIADKEMVTDSDKNHVSLKVLLADKNVETKDKEKEKKASTKDRVLSFRRRVSKDNVSPVKPGSPKDGSGQQDWNSPARLPVEKKPKGRKQQWVPFICCSSVQ